MNVLLQLAGNDDVPVVSVSTDLNNPDFYDNARISYGPLEDGKSVSQIIQKKGP